MYGSSYNICRDQLGPNPLHSLSVWSDSSGITGFFFYLLFLNFWSDVVDVLDVALPHALGEVVENQGDSLFTHYTSVRRTFW